MTAQCSNSAPIGVFDSGVGGLSVLRHIREQLPQEDLLYVADSAHAPYGVKTPEQIQERSLLLAEFLLEQGAKALVVACNTATAAAATLLRERFSVPVIAMEPAVKPAVAATKTGVIGVLATSGTLQSARFAALLENHSQGVKVVTQAGLGLVECVERGELDTPATRELLMRYLQPILDDGADTLVLGCTHYPFLRETIAALVGDKLQLVDTGVAVARQVYRRMEENGLLRDEENVGQERFWTTGDLAQGQSTLRLLWGVDGVKMVPCPT